MADDPNVTGASGTTIGVRALDNGAGKDIQVVQASQAGVTGTESLVSLTNPHYMRKVVNRASAVVHRSAITAADKLSAPSTPTSMTDVTSGGSLAQGTAHYLAAVANNGYGTTTASGIATVTTAASGGSVHAVKATIAQVTGATSYDIFMSTSSTAPLWVARISETQRANANGTIVTAVGTVTNGSSLGAGVVQVNLLGTGQALTATNFTANNAYTPDTVAGVGNVNCATYEAVHIKVLLALTDLRSAPALTLVPFFKNQQDSLWDQGQMLGLPLLTGVGTGLRQDYDLKLDGATGLVVCIDTISGQGAAATVVVELY